jgi:enterobactin synthetase component D
LSVDVVFHTDLPHGRCVGVRVPPNAADATALVAAGEALSPEEQAFFGGLSPARKPSWLAGRLALRAAVADLGLVCGPILCRASGGPDLPGEITGSISHKHTLAVGLAARSHGGLSVGVDIEPLPGLAATNGARSWNNRTDISSRVMTPEELSALSKVPEAMRRQTVVLHFSIKESIYKALNPLLGRYISFQEASLDLRPEGVVHVSLDLKNKEGPFLAEARWTEIADHLLTTASVRPR